METLLSDLVRQSGSSQATPDTWKDNSSKSSGSNSTSNIARRKRTLTLEAAFSVKKSSYMQQKTLCSVVEDEEDN